MGAAVDFKGEETVDAAFEEKGENGADVAIAIGVPEVNTGGVEFFADTFVAGHNDVFEEIDGDDGAVFEADIFPAGSIVENDVREELIEGVFDELAAGFDHVFDHIGKVITGVGETFEGEHGADFAEHGTAVNAEGIVARGRMCGLECGDVIGTGWVVEAEALFLDFFPVIGRDNGSLQIMRDGVMAILGDFGEEAVGVAQDAGGFAFFNDRVAEVWMHPDICIQDVNAVEVEEEVGFGVVGDAVVAEHAPLGEVFVPVAELHIEAAVEGLVVHLAVEAFAVGHRAAPFGSAGGDGHSLIFCLS